MIKCKMKKKIREALSHSLTLSTHKWIIILFRLMLNAKWIVPKAANQFCFGNSNGIAFFVSNYPGISNRIYYNAQVKQFWIVSMQMFQFHRTKHGLLIARAKLKKSKNNNTNDNCERKKKRRNKTNNNSNTHNKNGKWCEWSSWK